jgi:enamine deaminase RidA (YjgF/YER057c/UK114 family)
MTGVVETKIKELGIDLPPAAAPAANYVPYMRSGKMIHTAGQLPISGGHLIATGLLGRDLDATAGQAAARQCAINIIAQLKAATGDLDRISRIVKITVFVASTPAFTTQHLVANGASDLLAAVFGEKGKHARSAVGVASLPLNAPVEIEAIVEVDE